ncbi:(Fe-S)-binding protein [Nitratifractor sp.]
MRPTVALFVPCYVDDFYPQAALATLEILEAQGFGVEYPQPQRCCGQPFINNGLLDEGRAFATAFADLFEAYDYIVAPSSSCIGTAKYRYDSLLEPERHRKLAPKLYELCEFLHDVVGLERLRLEHPFPHRVGLHNSCHALRELELARPSELMIPHFSKIEAVLSRIEGIEIVHPERDECCGFGGTFSVQESAVSAAMGRDRIADHRRQGVEIMAGVDLSCLMHMEGLARRDGTPMRFVHVAQILAGRADCE